MVSWGVHVLKSLNLKPQKVIAGAFYQFIVHLPLQANPNQWRIVAVGSDLFLVA